MSRVVGDCLILQSASGSLPPLTGRLQGIIKQQSPWFAFLVYFLYICGIRQWTMEEISIDPSMYNDSTYIWWGDKWETITCPYKQDDGRYKLKHRAYHGDWNDTGIYPVKPMSMPQRSKYLEFFGVSFRYFLKHRQDIGTQKRTYIQQKSDDLIISHRQ